MKPSPFVDGMVLYIENPKDSDKKLFEIINKYSIAFLDTGNEKSEKEIEKTIPFIIKTKNKIYLGINLNKEMQVLHIENCKTVLKEIEEDTKKWKDIPCSGIRKINIVKISISPKANYRFNAIPVKSSIFSQK